MPHRLNEVNILSPMALFMNFLYIPSILFLNQYAQQLVILAVFMVIDFIFGLARSYRLNINFSYNRIWSGIITKMLTMTIPFMLHFFALGVGAFDNQLDKVLPYGFSALIVIEFYSILGNFYTVKTGKELEDKDLLSFMVLKIRKFFEAWITAFRS